MIFKSFKDHKPLGQKVADFLRKAILQGEFKPGERLNETLIAKKLGISKSPVREALKVLVSENLVEIRNWRGTFVKDITVKEVEEIYMVLNLIEGTIIRLAAKNMNEKKENELKSIMEQMKRGFEKKDTHKNVMLSMKLHDFIRKASENTLLIQIHQYLNVQEQKFRKTSIMKSGDIAEIFKEHMAISETLLKRDENKAELLMKNHLDKARLRVLKNLNIGRGKIFPSSYEH